MKINKDFGILILRAGIGGLMLFHGIHKLIHGHEFIKSALLKSGLPQVLWVGVPIAEVAAPIFLILGMFTRISAALITVTMLFTILLVLGGSTFELNKFGGLSGELNLLFLFSSVALLFIGPGKYGINTGAKEWMA